MPLALKLEIPKYLKAPLLFSFLFFFILALTATALYFSLQPEIPLFFTTATPQETLAPKEWIFIFPALSLAMAILNGGAMRLCRHTDPILLKIFGWVSVVVELILLIAMIRIIVLVT